jgi:DNA transposition AAA+ family ATPase
MTRQQPADACDALRGELRAFMKLRPDLSADSIAQYTTLAPTTIRHFSAGTMNGGNAVLEQIRTVLDQARAGDILAPGGPNNTVTLTEDASRRVRKVRQRGTFYETQTVARIGETLDYCNEHASIGVISGDFGVGKTEAVKAWRRKAAGKTDCVVFEADEFTAANKVEFISMLALMFGLTPAGGSANAGRVFREVSSYLRQNPCLLILDQCEMMRPRVLQVVRQLWDKTADAGVGVVILSQQILLARMLSGKMIDLGALTSRVSIWTALTGLTRNEMAAIVRQEGLVDVDADAFDLWWRSVGGSMRRLMRSLDLLKAKHAGKRITAKTITGVAGHLFGMNIERGE